MAQQARPNIIGQTELRRLQLYSLSSAVTTIVPLSSSGIGIVDSKASSDMAGNAPGSRSFPCGRAMPLDPVFPRTAPGDQPTASGDDLRGRYRATSGELYVAAPPCQANEFLRRCLTNSDSGLQSS